jgi:hypothetical protein
MVTLIADFKADLISMARQRLNEGWGPDAAHISDEQAIVTFFDSFRRWPAIRPRKVWLADDFYCPPDHESGWNALRDKVLKGDDLRPHLSLKHRSVRNLDGLLNE